MAYRFRAMVKCLSCSEEFKPSKDGQRYCSRGCGNRGPNAGYRMAQKAKNDALATTLANTQKSIQETLINSGFLDGRKHGLPPYRWQSVTGGKLSDVEAAALALEPELVADELWPKTGRRDAIRRAVEMELGNSVSTDAECRQDFAFAEAA